ncbi:MAG: hypothetical protein J6S52_01985 [Prevotella sp.]|nr:hypothetical protein [Prevotella sp.]
MKHLPSKDLFVFLMFLMMSAVFWVLTTLNETYEAEVEVRLEIADVPANTVITQDLPDTIRVVVRDKGFNIMKYLYVDNMPVVRLAFQLYSGQQNHGGVTPGEIQKILRPRFGETCSILSVKADHLDFYYSHGAQKKVPLIFGGDASAKTNFYVMDVKVVPDSVMVMASQNALDTINACYTEAVDIDNLDKSVTKEVPLARITGAKTNIPRAKVRVVVDQLTEVVIPVQIRAVHLPPQTMLKTFPARVEVKVSVGMAMASRLRPEQFSVVVDYFDLAERSPKDKLPVRIASKPDYALKAWLTTTAVDYVIEHTP